MRTVLNQDMGEVNAGNGGKILGSREELFLHFMLPLTINFPMRDHNILNIGDISIFNSAVSFSSDCFTTNSPQFLASEQLMFHTFAPWSAHTINTHGYTHRSTRGGSPLMHYGGWGQRENQLIAIPAVYQANITCAHCQQHYGLAGPLAHGADWIKDAGYQSLSQIQFRGVCLCACTALGLIWEACVL